MPSAPAIYARISLDAENIAPVSNTRFGMRMKPRLYDQRGSVTLRHQWACGSVRLSPAQTVEIDFRSYGERMIGTERSEARRGSMFAMLLCFLPALDMG